jgi:DNA processing protein
VSRRKSLIALNADLRLPRQVVCTLALHFDKWAEKGCRSRPTRLSRELAIPRRYLLRAQQLIKTEDGADQELGRARDLGLQILTLADPGYPRCLLDLELPPPVLYSDGNLPQGPAIAVVGSRRASHEARQTAELFGRELATLGVTIVSGFARGVDAAAHRGALESPRGRTVAVLGCGLGYDYPPGHRRLGRQIRKKGAVLTEFPFQASPLPRNFPVRNRIIAALSLGTLVVQGTARSGSLITARLALELGRDVYAVPGTLYDDRSVGPNTLIRDGALLVQSPKDIVESLPTAIREQLEPSESSPSAPRLRGNSGHILANLPCGKLATAEQLAAATGLGMDIILSSLLELELGGWIRRFPGPSFGRRP